MIVSPFMIEFALAHHYSPDPAAELGVKYTSPVGRETRAWMIRKGLLTDDGEPTERLAKWVAALCHMPLPA